MFEQYGKTYRRGIGTLREQRTQRHGAKEAQASHSAEVHRGVQGFRR